MKRSAFVFLPLLFLALALLPGCSRLRQPFAVVERAAEEARQRQTVFSLADLKADCEKPAGAAEIFITHFVANSKDGADQELALFNAAFCQDLAVRVTRLPEVRGQVPGWVVQKVMGQLNMRTMTLTPESAIEVARLAGRRHALTGAIERQGDKLHARVEIWDAKAGKRVGDAIELTGTPQEFINREGWLAERIAGRIGARLMAADRAWLDRRQFHDVKDAIEIGRLMRHEGKDHTAQLAARRAGGGSQVPGKGAILAAAACRRGWPARRRRPEIGGPGSRALREAPGGGVSAVLEGHAEAASGVAPGDVVELAGDAAGSALDAALEKHGDVVLVPAVSAHRAGEGAPFRRALLQADARVLDRQV